MLIRQVKSMDSESLGIKKAGENTGLSCQVAGNLEISNLLEDFYKVVDLYNVIAEDSLIHQT